MRRRMDNLLYQNGIPTDRYVLGTLRFGKFVQGWVTGAMRLAHTCTGPGGVLHSYRVDSYIMLWQQTRFGGICESSVSHPTECKMRRHTPQSQGSQTATEGHVSICARLRTYGPYAQAGLEISKGGLSNTYKKCISRANFALLTRTLSISKVPSFLLYLYLRYLHINYPITYVYFRFLTTLLRFFDYFT